MSKSKQIAAGGIASSLCLLLMFLTGVFPFATYALPAMAGTLLVVVVLELNRATAVMVYVSVSLLSLFIAPDKEAALVFIFFFGYYPILKGLIEQIRLRPLELAVKYILFNGMMVLVYFLMIQFLGMQYVADEMMEYGPYGLYFLLGAGNFMFFYYDKALTGLISAYIYQFRPGISENGSMKKAFSHSEAKGFFARPRISDPGSDGQTVPGTKAKCTRCRPVRPVHRQHG